jgi:UDP-N-acetylglucosamine--N-acetylmuramyl-(pentapeptide) pyrophosphoryl-undecaprenol N-acetylglucosamine transferase
MTDTVVLVAGGTGGHVFPALALGETIRARGLKTEFIGDDRTETYYKKNNITAHIHAAGRMKPGILGKIGTVFGIGIGILQALDLYRETRPRAVVGFGGYPSFPAVFAAQILGIPTFLHEQNAVFGRANRMLAGRAKKIALSFADTALVPDAVQNKTHHTGNPIRGEILNQDYAYVPSSGDFHLFSFGGSQGSRIFSILPHAIALLEPELRARLIIVQQCRPEDMDMVATAYNKIAVTARLESYFGGDMPALYKWAHLMLVRAGASTVAEVALAGRPAIFVPLAASLDGDQAQNAAQMENEGAAEILAEKDFTPENIAARLSFMMRNPQHLAEAAAASQKLGRPDASDRLADLVLER